MVAFIVRKTTLSGLFICKYTQHAQIEAKLVERDNKAVERVMQSMHDKYVYA